MKPNEKEPIGSPFQGSKSMVENMRPADAALYTGLSESTLAKLRMRHNRADGPRHLKITGCVIYRRADLDEWMDQHIVGGLSDA
jgi:predicted DNA-binding transcriptional regulator AlpA